MSKKNQKGQTSVEYLLMVVVALVLGFTFKKRMDEYFFKSPNSFIAKSLRNYKVLFSGTVNGRPYKRFQVMQIKKSR